MIYKRCSKCGRRVPTGKKCECLKKIEQARQKYYDKNQRDKRVTAFYNSKEWHTLQKMAVEKFNGLDVLQLYQDHKITPGRIVHHIIPIKEDWSRRLDIHNLILLTDESHYAVHQRMDKGDKSVRKELMQLVLRWEREKQAEVE